MATPDLLAKPETEEVEENYRSPCRLQKCEMGQQ
jgi:hypothetical protein